MLRGPFDDQNIVAAIHVSRPDRYFSDPMRKKLRVQQGSARGLLGVHRPAMAVLPEWLPAIHQSHVRRNYQPFCRPVTVQIDVQGRAMLPSRNDVETRTHGVHRQRLHGGMIARLGCTRRASDRGDGRSR